MKKLPILALCALMLAIGIGLSALLPQAAAADATTTAPAVSEPSAARLLALESKLARIDTIADRIIDRQIIESALLVYVEDEALKTQLLAYNSDTARWYGYFYWRAQNTIVALLDLRDENGEYIHVSGLTYLDLPPMAIDFIEHVGRLSLYKNHIELFAADPVLGGLITSEGGGSYGIWHWWYHDMDTEEGQAELDTYLALEDTLLPALEAYKASLLTDEGQP